MKIAILSDIHDHDQRLAQALKIVRERAADQMILLGDIVAPTTFRQLIQGFTGEIHVVFGNNDGDLIHLEKCALEAGSRVHMYGDFGEAELAGVRFAFFHKPAQAHALARSGMYDVVLFGHTHKQHSEILAGAAGDTLIANPGGVRDALIADHNCSFAIFDTTEPKKVEFISLS